MKKTTALFLTCCFAFVACGAAQWTAPNSWTLRADGRVKASQRKEDFSVPEFIAKVKREEAHDYALIVTPNGEADISRHIRELNAKVTSLSQQLRDCKGGQ